MTNKVPSMRPDETGKHVESDSPVDRPAQGLEIEEFDKKKRSSGASDETSDERHEKRPEGPYKDPADEMKQGAVK